MKRTWTSVVLAGACELAIASSVTALAAEGGKASPIDWKSCLRQKAQWYGTGEAVRIADSVLLYQRDSGGWAKNIDMAAPLDDKARADLAGKKGAVDTTIDNGATYTQAAFLGRVYAVTKQGRFRDGFLKGLDFLLKAQYPNGGWPQFFPNAGGYYRHITFNDDAMIGVMRLLRDVAGGAAPYAFVDDARRAAAARAVEKGVECVLKCQVVVDGQRTAWCAQHDEQTLQPAPARSYEKASLSGAEGVGIVRFLMEIDRPSAEVVEAVQASVAWFYRVRLTGIRQVQKPDASQPNGQDKVVVQDPAAPPLWARFYEIGANRPIFCGRDGVVKYSLAEIEHERRTGYAWYGDWPARLLEKDYPAWQQKWAPDRNVLRK